MTLPLNDGDAVLVVSGVFGLDDYILYHTFSIFTDGAQPIREQAWVMKVDDPTSNKEIAQFHSSGGKFYSYAVDEKKNFIYRFPYFLETQMVAIVTKFIFIIF